MTTVSFIEYPTIVKTAATIDKLISKLNNENIPKLYESLHSSIVKLFYCKFNKNWIEHDYKIIECQYLSKFGVCYQSTKKSIVDLNKKKKII